MILTLMRDSDYTEQAIENILYHIPHQKIVKFSDDWYGDQIDPTDDTVFFIYLGGVITQQSLPPKAFAEHLIEAGMPKTVRKIYVIMSDIDPANRPLFSFASTVARILSVEGYNLTVYAPIDPQYSITVVVPPEDNAGAWKVYGIRRSDAKVVNEAMLFAHHSVSQNSTRLACKEKELIYTGKDIREWLEEPSVRRFHYAPAGEAAYPPLPPLKPR